MAEEIKLSVEADKLAIYVYDATGSFDKDCNPGGWGAPNLEPSDIEEATVEIFPPESDIGITVDVSAALPNKDGFGFEILAEDLGLSEISDGIWKFIYKTTSVSNSFEETFCVNKYFDEISACCVDGMINSFDISNLLSEGNKKIVEMEMLFDNARRLACKGNIKGAQTVTNHVNIQCKCCK